jgi:hypothetical protein
MAFFGSSRLQGYREKRITGVGNPPAGRTSAHTIQSSIAEPAEHVLVEIDRPLQIGNREINVTERASNHYSLRRAPAGHQEHHSTGRNFERQIRVTNGLPTAPLAGPLYAE